MKEEKHESWFTNRNIMIIVLGALVFIALSDSPLITIPLAIGRFLKTGSFSQRVELKINKIKAQRASDEMKTTTEAVHLIMTQTHVYSREMKNLVIASTGVAKEKQVYKDWELIINDTKHLCQQYDRVGRHLNLGVNYLNNSYQQLLSLKRAQQDTNEQFVAKYKLGIHKFRNPLIRFKQNIQDVVSLNNRATELNDLLHLDILNYTHTYGIRLNEIKRGWTLSDYFKYYGAATFSFYLIPLKFGLFAANPVASALSAVMGALSVGTYQYNQARKTEEEINDIEPMLLTSNNTLMFVELIQHYFRETLGGKIDYILEKTQETLDNIHQFDENSYVEFADLIYDSFAEANSKYMELMENKVVITNGNNKEIKNS